MLFSHFLARAKKSHDRQRFIATSPRAAAMEPRRSDRIKISKERDFGVLLGALIRELPDVFEAEVLTKLSVKDHFALAQVNKECKDVVYKIPPLQFIRSKCIDFHSAMYCAKPMSTALSENDVLNPMRYETAKMGRLDVLKWVCERDPSRRPVIQYCIQHVQSLRARGIIPWEGA